MRSVPARDRRDAADHPHRRALPRPVRAEEAERLARSHVEVDAVDGDEVAETLHEAAGVDHGAVHAHGSNLPAYTGRTASRVAATSRAIWSTSSASLPKDLLVAKPLPQLDDEPPTVQVALEVEQVRLDPPLLSAVVRVEADRDRRPMAERTRPA